MVTCSHIFSIRNNTWVVISWVVLINLHIVKKRPSFDDSQRHTATKWSGVSIAILIFEVWVWCMFYVLQYFYIILSKWKFSKNHYNDFLTIFVEISFSFIFTKWFKKSYKQWWLNAINSPGCPLPYASEDSRDEKSIPRVNHALAHHLTVVRYSCRCTCSYTMNLKLCICWIRYCHRHQIY